MWEKHGAAGQAKDDDAIRRGGDAVCMSDNYDKATDTPS
jgi:hypothetical protein